MGSHYIAIKEWMRPYADAVRSLPSSDWQRFVFDDLTDGGKTIYFRHLPPNAEGPRIALYGKVFVCEAGLDRTNKDTLFLHRVESADTRLPQSEPEVYAGKFVLSASSYDRSMGELDDVEPLCPREARVEAVNSDSFGVMTTVDGPLGKSLREALREVPDLTRGRWKPRPDLVARGKLQSAMVRIWRRTALSSYAVPSPRVEGLLTELIRPGSLKDKDFYGLLGMLDSETVTALVEGEPDFARVVVFLDLAADIPLAESYRARIWAAMCAGTGAGGLRRELQLLAADPTIDWSGSWSEGLFGGLQDAAVDLDDLLLEEQLEVASTADDPLNALLQWANALTFGTDQQAESSIVDSRNSEEATPGVLSKDNQTSETISPGVGDDHRGTKEGAERDALKSNDTESFGGKEWAATAAERWVMRLRFDEAELDQLSAEIRAATAHVLEMVTGPWTLTEVIRFQQGAGALSRQIDNGLTTLPSATELQVQREAAEEGVRLLAAEFGEDAEVLIDSGLTPSNVEDVVRLSQADELLRSMPSWIWAWSRTCVTTSAKPGGKLERAKALIDPEFRDLVERVSSLLIGLDEGGLTAISRLEEPQALPSESTSSSEGEVERRGLFLADVRAAIEMHRSLASLDPCHRNWVARHVDSGASAESVQVQVELLEGVRAELNESAFSDMVRSLEAEEPPEIAGRVASLVGAVRAISAMLGSAQGIQFEGIDTASRRETSPQQTIGVGSEAKLVIDRPRADATGRKIPLVWVPLEDRSRPYGLVATPIRLRSPSKIDGALHLDITTKGFDRKAWPPGWDSPSPENLSLASSGWRNEDGEWVFDFTLKIPCRKPEDSLASCELNISIDGGRPELRASVSLNWPGMEVWSEPIEVEWPDVVNPISVGHHPVGPQVRYAELQNKIDQHSSFAVMAPRRFGKSTLVEYLREVCIPHGQRGGLVVCPPIFVCTNYASGKEFEYPTFWQDLSDRLHQELGAGLPGFNEKRLPGPEAFDHARRAAKRMGRNSIVVLLDEAQLFFPVGEAASFGTRLKFLLERHWGIPSEDMVPVVFGFVGLPSMRERGGTDLMGLLRPIHMTVFEPPDLNRLILKVTKDRIQTTRACRQLLARESKNLFLLKTILDKLQSSLNDEGRSWLDQRDVEKVVSRLKLDLSRGGHGAATVANYLRDPFNQAFQINDWRPMPCFPTAVALAQAFKQGMRHEPRRTKRAVQLLNEYWSKAGSTGREIAVYTEERVEEHIRRLEDLDLYETGEGFKSGLVAAWLVGVAKKFPRSEEDRRALFAGGLQRVSLPEVMDPVSEGGQAQVFRYQSETGRPMALRQVALKTPEARQRFEESVQILTQLREGVLRHEAGWSSIYELHSIGLAADRNGKAGDELGVEIYEWISGIPLEERVGTLDGVVLAFLASKLVQGLALLHRHQILHRDVRPSNIILAEEHGTPVLIDFGLARAVKDVMNTEIATVTAAPEVRSEPPQWSAKADIYSLGVTMRQLLAPSSAPEVLENLIKECTATAPEERPSAEELASRLDQLVALLKADETQREFWDSLRTTVSEELGKSWFKEVLEKFRTRFGLLGLGLHSRFFDQAVELSGFCDQVLEHYPGPQKLSLSSFKQDFTGADYSALHALHMLRLYRSHGGKQNTEARTRSKLKVRNDAELEVLLLRGAELIGGKLSVPGLRELCATALRRTQV